MVAAISRRRGASGATSLFGGTKLRTDAYCLSVFGIGVGVGRGEQRFQFIEVELALLYRLKRVGDSFRRNSSPTLNSVEFL